MIARRAPWAVLVAALAGLCALGAAGADFGRHWDERRIVRAVARSAESGVLLPHCRQGLP